MAIGGADFSTFMVVLMFKLISTICSLFQNHYTTKRVLYNLKSRDFSLVIMTARSRHSNALLKSRKMLTKLCPLFRNTTEN